MLALKFNLLIYHLLYNCVLSKYMTEFILSLEKNRIVIMCIMQEYII